MKTVKRNCERVAGKIAAALCIAGLLASCAAPSGMATDSSQQTAPDPADAQYEYLLGAGDTVAIHVWRNPEVSQTVPVRPDGKITMPLIQDLPASGKTPTQLAGEIQRLLGKYIQDPVVTVTVTNFVGPYSEQIRVVGQAAKPQALPYRKGMSLMDVVIAVGGLAEFAAGNSATITRTVDGKQERIPVRLNDLIKRGDVSANIPVKPGDVLIIPESFF